MTAKKDSDETSKSPSDNELFTVSRPMLLLFAMVDLLQNAFKKKADSQGAGMCGRVRCIAIVDRYHAILLTCPV